MGKMAIDRSQSTPVDAFLRDELARSNRALRTLAPVVSHLLQSDGPSLVSDAAVARLRGMLDAIVDEVITKVALSASEPMAGAEARANLVESLSTDEPIVEHLYALALEGVLAQQLSQRAGIDPVLSPLLQELIAADRPEIASLAMNTLAAQSRFAQGQARMEIALAELPAECISRVLGKVEQLEIGVDQSETADAIAKIKLTMDESESRVALLSRLVTSLQGGAIAALKLDHAGLALFASSVAFLTKQTRESAVYACHDGQNVRLALMLKAAGLEQKAVEQQLAHLDGGFVLPSGFDTMRQSHAIDALSELSGD